MAVPWNLAHRVVVQRDLHDLRQRSQRMQVLLLTQLVDVKVQKFQAVESSEQLWLRQSFEKFVREVDLF